MPKKSNDFVPLFVSLENYFKRKTDLLFSKAVPIFLVFQLGGDPINCSCYFFWCPPGDLYLEMPQRKLSASIPFVFKTRFRTKSNMFRRSVAISCRDNLDERIPVCANIGDASTIQKRRPASWLGERLNLKPDIIPSSRIQHSAFLSARYLLGLFVIVLLEHPKSTAP